MITIQGAENKHLQGILDLQQYNLPKNLSDHMLRAEGFVTIEHNFELLKSMNDIHPHAVAVNNEKVVGYALAMDKSMASRVPFLNSFFDRIRAYLLVDNPSDLLNFIVMGQVCIDREHRSQGLFEKLMNNLKFRLSDSYNSIFTEVACKNTRSIRAHKKMGYKSVEVFKVGDEYWDILEWRWNL